MGKISILSEKPISQEIDENVEFETIGLIKQYTVFSENELDQHQLAYDVFKTAKYVSLISSTHIGEDAGYIYVVQTTSYSAEEQMEINLYGEEDILEY